MGFQRHHSALVVASVVTVASFVGATAYTQNRLARLDALSSTIETNSVPSIEYLSRAAVRLNGIRRLLDDLAGSRRAAALPSLREEVRAIDHDIAAYLRLTPLPGEKSYWSILRADAGRAVQLVDSIIEAESGHPPVQIPDRARVDEALEGAVRTVLTTLEFDVRQSEAMARDVRRVRATTLQMIIALDAAATVVALVAVFVAYRASRRHDELLDAHSSLLADRVAELDRFAGRVSHDILSPLGTISAGLALLARSGYDSCAQTYIDRSQRAVERVQQLVGDLLTFARSGARADPTSLCAVDAVLPSILADCSVIAAEKGINLAVETTGSPHVRCSVGAMTSIVQNLVRNAINYMGTRDDKRIVLRAKPAGPVLRLEVEDTGLGIPDELQATMFEPFVRGSNTEVSGTGLGLATVKRLVESHGGAIGVRSEPGIGSLFWVELPLVPANVEHTVASTAGDHV